MPAGSVFFSYGKTPKINPIYHLQGIIIIFDKVFFQTMVDGFGSTVNVKPSGEDTFGLHPPINGILHNAVDFHYAFINFVLTMNRTFIGINNLGDGFMLFLADTAQFLKAIKIVGNFISRNFSIQSVHLPFLSGSKKNFFVAP